MTKNSQDDNLNYIHFSEFHTEKLNYKDVTSLVLKFFPWWICCFCSYIQSLLSESVIVKVSKSQKQFIVSSILPKIERWDNSMYWKLSQCWFFGRIEDTIIYFLDCLTFSGRSLFWVHCPSYLFSLPATF